MCIERHVQKRKSLLYIDIEKIKCANHQKYSNPFVVINHQSNEDSIHNQLWTTLLEWKTLNQMINHGIPITFCHKEFGLQWCVSIQNASIRIKRYADKIISFNEQSSCKIDTHKSYLQEVMFVCDYNAT